MAVRCIILVEVLELKGEIYYTRLKITPLFFVGHTAIVGDDFNVYHAFNNSSGKLKDSLFRYYDRFSGSRMRILKPRNSSLAIRASQFARILYSSVNNYVIDYHLNTYSNNYCSKFVWQAYYFGNYMNTDILGKGYNHYVKDMILPSEILNSPNLRNVGSFYP